MALWSSMHCLPSGEFEERNEATAGNLWEFWQPRQWGVFTHSGVQLILGAMRGAFDTLHSDKVALDSCLSQLPILETCPLDLWVCIPTLYPRLPPFLP